MSAGASLRANTGRLDAVRTWTAVCVALAALAVPTRAHAHVAGAASIDRYLDFVYVGDGRFRVFGRSEHAGTGQLHCAVTHPLDRQ